MNVYLKLCASAAVTATLVALMGCSGAESDYAAAPPPPPAYAPPPPPPVLAGGPLDNGLAGGPVYAAPPVAVSSGMAPVPDPEDLPPSERHRIYGYKYDRGGQRAGAVRPAPRRAATYAAPAPARAGAPPARTVAAPARPAARPAPAPAARPAAVQPAPAKPVIAAKPPVNAEPVAKAPPVLTPIAPAKPVAPAKPLDAKTAKLQAALNAPVAAASTLNVGPAIAAGQPDNVVLTLPQNLFDLIRQEARKLGLTRAARSSEVSATLSGSGYTITPNGAQTAKLKSGEAPSFTWNVAPTAGAAQSPLTAHVDASLKGERAARTFSLATLENAVKVAWPAPPKKNWLPKLDLSKLNIGGLKLPDYGTVDVPGIGKASSRTLIGVGLVALAVILLIAIATRAAEAKARARRRRKFRTMADYGAMDEEPAYEPATVYAAPEPVHHQVEAPVETVTTTTYAAPAHSEVRYVEHEEPRESEKA